LPKDPRICTYCANKLHDVCVACSEEGRYRFLEADTLASWESPPELPSMREVVDLPAAERLALLWLAVRFAERERVRGGDI